MKMDCGLLPVRMIGEKSALHSNLGDHSLLTFIFPKCTARLTGRMDGGLFGT